MTPFGYAAPGGGNFGRSGGGGVDLGEQCWIIEDICQVTIDTFACANGLCPAEVKIAKARKIGLKDFSIYGCENCILASTKVADRQNDFCGATLIPPARPGTHKLFKCITATTICAQDPGPTWYQSIDFNCGPGALGSRGDDQEKLAAKMEECMERKYGDSQAPGGGGDSKFCETLCDLANMANPPGGGPDGTPGGIGNKQMCVETPAGVGPISQQGGYNWQQERCEDKLSAEFMKALGEWLDKNCK